MLNRCKQLLENGFRQLGTILKEILVRKVVTNSYSTESGVCLTTYTDIKVKAHISKFSKREIDNINVLATDRKVLFLKDDCSTVDTTYKISIDGKIYNIVNVNLDPTGALWQIQLR